MTADYIPFSPPCVGPEEIAEVADTLRSDWLTTGPKTRQFEALFASCFQAPGALAVNSCTAALHVALKTHGIGPGDEVITTGLTFAASVNVIEHVGARPVLVDVEPDTLNLAPDRVAAAVTPRTRAIIAVHYAGHPANLDALRSIAETHRLLLVEDAAHAVYAKYRGEFIGSGRNPAAFSFYATKNLTTGEGGMLTGEPGFLDEARIFSLHGLSREAWTRYGKGGSWRYDVAVPGFKYNMTDIQAAIGTCQLRKLPDFQRRRREIAEAYNEAFARLPDLEIPVERSDVDHAWHLYPLRLNTEYLSLDRDSLIEQLGERNIGTSVHFIPIQMHSYYRNKYGFCLEDYPVTQRNFHRLVSLPLNPKLTDAQVARVIEAVEDILLSHRRRAAA